MNEREQYLRHYRELMIQRRLQKRQGRRCYTKSELNLLEARRAAHNDLAPKQGYFGWRAMRDSLKS